MPSLDANAYYDLHRELLEAAHGRLSLGTLTDLRLARSAYASLLEAIELRNTDAAAKIIAKVLKAVSSAERTAAAEARAARDARARRGR